MLHFKQPDENVSLAAIIQKSNCWLNCTFFLATSLVIYCQKKVQKKKKKKKNPPTDMPRVVGSITQNSIFFCSFNGYKQSTSCSFQFFKV